MATIEIAGIPPTQVERFLETLEQAVQRLDILGQIQAAAGTVSMQYRARDTFEVHAILESYLRMLKNAQDRINR